MDKHGGIFHLHTQVLFHADEHGETRRQAITSKLDASVLVGNAPRCQLGGWAL